MHSDTSGDAKFEFSVDFPSHVTFPLQAAINRNFPLKYTHTCEKIPTFPNYSLISVWSLVVKPLYMSRDDLRFTGENQNHVGRFGLYYLKAAVNLYNNHHHVNK